MVVQGKKTVRKNAGIRLMDTRGQIYLDEKEEAHIDLMMSVNILINIFIIIKSGECKK